MKGMDFKGFKKVGSKDGKTTFKHADGHWLSVAHKSLSSGHQKQIDSLPSYNEEATNFDQGGQVPPMTLEGISKGFNGATGMPKPAPKNYAKGSEDGVVSKDDSAPQAYPPDQPSALFATSLPDNSVLPGKFSPQDSQQMAQPEEPPEEPPIGAGSAESTAIGGNEGAAPPDAQSPQTGQAATGPLAAHQLMAGEAEKLQHDLNNGHIQPETYKDLFNKKDTLGKIGTIFGLLVGGAGSALSHQPDALMEMMDKEIKRDLEAQQNSSSNAQNFLRINQQNPILQAQIKKIGADTNSVNLANAYTQQWQTTVNELSNRYKNMPESTPQQIAMKQKAAQALQATVQMGLGKVANAHALAASMTQPGTPEQQAATQPQSDNNSAILSPQATSILPGIKNDPYLAPIAGDIQSQATKASQAEKGIEGAKGAFEGMMNNRSILGPLVKMTAGLPYHLGDVVSSLANANPTQRKFDSFRTRVVESIANSTPLTKDQASDVVTHNLPILTDSPESVKTFLDSIVGSIKRAVPTDKLEQAQKRGFNVLNK